MERDGCETKLFHSRLLKKLEQFQKTSLFTDGVLVEGEKKYDIHLNVLACIYPHWFARNCALFPKRIPIKNNTPGEIDRFVELLYMGIQINECSLKNVINGENSSQDKEDATEESFSRNCQQTFEKLRNDRVLCDVQLLLSDKTALPCHRNVLAAHSPYFKSLFLTCLKEKGQNLADLTFFDAPDVKEVINYMYTGCISITGDNARSLLEISDYFLVETLKHEISLFMGRHYLNAQTFWAIFSMAQTYNSNVLNQITENFFYENFSALCRSETILKIELEKMEWLVSKERLYTEETVLIDLIYKWFRQNEGKSKTELQSLLNHVYFHCIPDDLKLPALNNLDSAIEAIQSFCDIGCLNRTVIPANLCVIASFYNQVKIWLPRYDRTIDLCNLSRALPSVILFGYDQLYIFGGAMNCRQMEGCSAEVLCYSLETSDPKCEAKRPMKVGVLQPALCILDQRIYVIGGENKLFQSQKIVQVYDPRTDTWKFACELNEVHSTPCVISYDSCIYVIGGHTGRAKCNLLSPLKSVERYDSRSNQWHYIAPLIEPRVDAQGFAFSSKLLVVGGFNLSAHGRNCETYDPLTNEWTLVSSFCSISKVYAICEQTEADGPIFLLQKVKKGDCGVVINCFDPISGDIQKTESTRKHGMTSPLVRLLTRKTLASLLDQKTAI